MIKYYKTSSFYDVNSLLEKERRKRGEDLKYDAKIDLESPVGGRAEEMKVPNSVAWELELRRKSPLYMIVGGLTLQIIQMVF